MKKDTMLIRTLSIGWYAEWERAYGVHEMEHSVWCYEQGNSLQNEAVIRAILQRLILPAMLTKTINIAERSTGGWAKNWSIFSDANCDTFDKALKRSEKLISVPIQEKEATITFPAGIFCK